MSDHPLTRLRGSLTYIVDWFVDKYDLDETLVSSMLRNLADEYENRGEGE